MHSPTMSELCQTLTAKTLSVHSECISGSFLAVLIRFFVLMLTSCPHAFLLVGALDLAYLPFNPNFVQNEFNQVLFKNI